MSGLKFQDVVTLLGPGSGQVLIWSIFLYVIFFLSLITMLNVPNKNMLPTVMVAIVLLCTIVAKLSVSSANVAGSKPIIGKKDFGMFAINAGMVVLPLIAVGMTRVSTRTSKRANKASAPAILTSVIAFVYFFMFWLLAQH
jgi:hypothetical protein